jgi:hypothetical protein
VEHRWPVGIDANLNQSLLAPELAATSAAVVVVDAQEVVVALPVPRVTVTAGPVSGKTLPFFYLCLG